MKRIKGINVLLALFISVSAIFLWPDYAQITVHAENETKTADMADRYSAYGGGYAASSQLEGVSYTSKVYDDSNGLPTSDAMYIMCADNGYIWIGGNSGVVLYDGTEFETLDTADGLTSSRCFYEDSKGRIWVGTNDNGVVVIDKDTRKQYTYKDGLPSSSIRIFEEDNRGNIFIGTTSGLCYVDAGNNMCELPKGKLSEERVLRLSKGPSGTIYGQTANGLIFAIDGTTVTDIYTSAALEMDKVTTILADPDNEGMVYLGTEGSIIYHGRFGDSVDKMEIIDVSPLTGVHWLNYDCNRVWVSSTSQIGYLDLNNRFKLLSDIPMDSGIEMITSDYQGNMWAASSTMGVMKLVTNNFVDVTYEAGLPKEVTNAICLHRGYMYIGTENGLRIIAKNGEIINNYLTECIGDAKVRSIMEDLKGNLWIGCYSNDLGLICYSSYGQIESFNSARGMPSNQIRSTTMDKDGRIIVGSNGGISVIENRVLIRNIGIADGVENTVIPAVISSNEGMILAGSDGDGIYVIEDDHIDKINRENSLTSDVIRRLIKDDEREVIWIITSNSIQYMKSGTVYQVSTFPANNNFDMYFDNSGNAWVMSSYGVYVINADDMLRDNITEYRLYTTSNGLPYAITVNSHGYLDDNGDLYIGGRGGVIKVNINNYLEMDEEILLNVKSVYCDNDKINCDENGVYEIPATDGRVQITPAILDYTMLNPTVRVYLEGGPDDGVTYERNKLSPLEYTGLPYGNYTLHIQVLSSGTKNVLQDQTFTIKKDPKMGELILFRVLILLVIAIITGYLVWQIMHSTVVRKQYDEINRAKEEAERANAAKTMFLANMSHEIRTPINTIMGMNEMVMRENPTNVPKSYFLSVMNYSLDIRNAAEALLGLINDLLDMSKIESGKMHLVELEYDTQEMLRSVVSMIRARSTDKGLTFDVIIDDMLPKRMYGDVSKIKQVVINLLTNAVKYTSSGGLALSVSMEERHDREAHVRFSVKDTGMGVKEEDMEKLFTAYERLDEEKNSAIQGTGLGLDISRRFAELMGGKLWCESVYGEGSEFILTVTQNIVDETPLGAFIEHEESSVKGPYIPKFIAPDADILVVDDNPMNLNVIKGLLKATKVFVTTAESGEDAVDLIKDNDFDVVLLDHMMPGMDGIETLAVIRKFKPDLPVYALTANAVAGEEFYKSKGFNGYLSKPIDSQTLEKTLMLHIPEYKMEKASAEDAVEELTELPEDMKWLYDVEGISVPDGIETSGGVSSYIFSLNLFLDTLDENSRVIRESYDNDNIRMYTIKVHALKTSARIIGAKELSEFAARLEEAGNNQDMDFIGLNTDAFLEAYESFREKLAGLKQPENDEDKEPVPDDELQDAYAALSELVPMMDYDSIEMVLGSMAGYRLPEEDAKFFEELGKLLKTFDWDKIKELMAGRG